MFTSQLQFSEHCPVTVTAEGAAQHILPYRDRLFAVNRRKAALNGGVVRI